MEGIHEVLPKQGLVEQDQKVPYILCKPKLLAMKSVTLEKLETMQKEAQDMVRAQEEAEKEPGLTGFSGNQEILNTDTVTDRISFESNDYETLTKQYYGAQ